MFILWKKTSDINEAKKILQSSKYVSKVNESVLPLHIHKDYIPKNIKECYYSKTNKILTVKTDKSFNFFIPENTIKEITKKKLLESLELPNENSLGNPITDSKEVLSKFWNWFGQSKVVDEKGRPIVVYHGTTKEFDEFRQNEGDVIYFTDNIEMSYDYGDIVKTCYLRMNNPYIVEGTDEIDWYHIPFSLLKGLPTATINRIKELNDEQNKCFGEGEESMKNIDDCHTGNLSIAIQETTNYDGIIIKNINEGFGIANDYIVFKNIQIKAISNKIYGENPKLNESYPDSFNMDEFKALKTFRAKIEYCQNRLQRISSGTGRIVYKIDDEKVLKLARNEKGIRQNEVEVSVSEDNYAEIVAKVYDYDSNYLWIEMQLAEKCTPKKFEELTGLNFSEFADFLRWHQNQNSRFHSFTIPNELKQKVYNNGWYNKFQDYTISYDIPLGDMQRISSYGIIDGEVVIVDYGYNRDTEELYHKKFNY